MRDEPELNCLVQNVLGRGNNLSIHDFHCRFERTNLFGGQFSQLRSFSGRTLFPFGIDFDDAQANFAAPSIE